MLRLHTHLFEDLLTVYSCNFGNFHFCRFLIIIAANYAISYGGHDLLWLWIVYLNKSDAKNSEELGK
jgi:hypothetical protein